MFSFPSAQSDGKGMGEKSDKGIDILVKSECCITWLLMVLRSVGQSDKHTHTCVKMKAAGAA